MGAGSTGAGRGGAGFTPPVQAVVPVVAPPVALRFEGSVKDWVTDDSGANYRSVTSTEQGMIMSIAVEQGQIKSSPLTGHTLREIVYLGQKNLQADVEDRLRNANPAKALIAAGKAAIVRVLVQVSNRKLEVEMFFKALDTPNRQVLSSKWSN